MATRDALVLPEPAATLWATKGRAIVAVVRAHLHEKTAYKIGGGTVLAARWGHRRSTDVDLKLEPKTGLNALSPRFGDEFQREIHRVTGRWPRFRQDQISIDLTPEGGEPQKIDLFEGPTTPARGHTRVELAGRPETVLSSAQILTGKLAGRALHAPVRDLFDVAVARREDRRALEIAVNACSNDLTGSTVLKWLEAGDAYREDATEDLLDVPARYADICEQVAEHAVQALKDARYRALDIEWSGPDRLTARTTAMDGAMRSETLDATTRGTLLDDLEEHGLRAWLDHERPGVENHILRRVEETRDRRQLPVYEETPR